MTWTKLPAWLSVARMLLGPAFAVALANAWPRGASGGARSLDAGGEATLLAALPLFLASLASLSDFVDGRLARRLGSASPSGAALDVAADAAFLLVALSALAAAGLLSWFLPVAAAVSLAALALEWASRRQGDSRRTRANGDRSATRTARAATDQIGHLAGICNFGAVLVASGVPLGVVAAGWLPAASRALALLNLAPVVLRALGRR